MTTRREFLLSVRGGHRPAKFEFTASLDERVTSGQTLPCMGAAITLADYLYQKAGQKREQTLDSSRGICGDEDIPAANGSAPYRASPLALTRLHSIRGKLNANPSAISC
jgi:hypothetical protein